MIRIGVICPSDIAFRRFMPALLQETEKFKFIGVAMASPEEWFNDLEKTSKEAIKEQQEREYDKAKEFVNTYSGKIFKSYSSLVCSEDVDAIYIPLPPALHYEWAKLSLKNQKHVFVEKPATSQLSDTSDLIKIASLNKLALHENYMFIYHSQLTEMQNIVKSGEIGDVRLYRLTFGFPRRTSNDFRYNKDLGGGALLDAGGYTFKYASYLLGETAEIKAAQVNYIDDFDVDVYGSATMINEEGITAQLAFGMDNDYRCDIEIWGSKGTLTSGRVFTAPEGYIPNITIKKNQEYEDRKLSADDSFKKSINFFYQCIQNEAIRKNNYQNILKQAELVSMFKKI